MLPKKQKRRPPSWFKLAGYRQERVDGILIWPRDYGLKRTLAYPGMLSRAEPEQYDFLSGMRSNAGEEREDRGGNPTVAVSAMRRLQFSSS